MKKIIFTIGLLLITSLLMYSYNDGISELQIENIEALTQEGSPYLPSGVIKGKVLQQHSKRVFEGYSLQPSFGGCASTYPSYGYYYYPVYKTVYFDCCDPSNEQNACDTNYASKTDC